MKKNVFSDSSIPGQGPCPCQKQLRRPWLNFASKEAPGFRRSVGGQTISKMKERIMDPNAIISVASIVTAGLTISIGSIGPALGEGRALAQALTAIAQQPDEANTITRTLFVGLAMVESTAIYCFVVSMILLFANPFLK